MRLKYIHLYTHTPSPAKGEGVFEAGAASLLHDAAGTSEARLGAVLRSSAFPIVLHFCNCLSTEDCSGCCDCRFSPGGRELTAWSLLVGFCCGVAFQLEPAAGTAVPPRMACESAPQESIPTQGQSDAGCTWGAFCSWTHCCCFYGAGAAL